MNGGPPAFELGVHRWSFPRCTLREAAAIARTLDLSFLDLGAAFDHDPQTVAADPAGTAELVRAAIDGHGLALRDAFLHFDPRFSTNHPDAARRAEHRATAGGYLTFAAAAGSSGVTVSPGMVWPGDTRAAATDRAVAMLTELVEMGDERGLLVRIEPHVASVTHTPEATLEVLERVPGLSLTLDPSHFLAVGIEPWELEPLAPHATHWHLRQARLGSGQARFDDGTIDLGALVRGWSASGYAGGVCLEYVHSPWLGLDGVDCLTETVRLRDEVRRLVAAAGDGGVKAGT